MAGAEETAGQIFAKLLDDQDLDESQLGVAFSRNRGVICTTLPTLVGSHVPGIQGIDCRANTSVIARPAEE